MTTFRLGITLLEILVILAIIVILSLLIIGSGTTGPQIRKDAGTILEMQLLGSAIEDLRNEFGDYPPNLQPNVIEQDSAMQSVSPKQDILRMFRKAFPRSKEPDSVVLALAGQSSDSNNTLPLHGGMTASESIYFWLGGFSQDPEYPLSNIGGPSFTDAEGNNDGILAADDEDVTDRNWRYDFDASRLGPRTDEGHFDDSGLAKGGGRYIEYDDPRNGDRRRINFWHYFPQSSQVAFVYFDASRYTPVEYYPAKHPLLSVNVGPMQMLRKDKDAHTPIPNERVFVEQGKFQILHAGLDGVWGDFKGIRSGETLAPMGPFSGEIADTLANFMVGRLEDIQD